MNWTIWATVAFAAIGGTGAAAQTPKATLQVLYSFNRPGSMGSTPLFIAEVSPGNFMGIAGNGAEIYSVTSTGSYQNLFVFPSIPSGIGAIGLAPALNGQVYGSAEQSGDTPTFSELFSVALDGTFTAYPYNPSTVGGADVPVQHPDNHLYAVLGKYGSARFARLDYQGNPTFLHTFSASEGAPYLTFLGATGDFFYGLSMIGEFVDVGMFRISTEGEFSWIIPSLSPPNGANYGIDLLQAGNGNFYGTLPNGGSAGLGSIFEATLDGKLRTVYSFPNANFDNPENLIEASDGMLYGTALGGDTPHHNNAYSNIFRVDPSNGQFETVYVFNQGGWPACPCKLVQGTDGRIYGISYYQNSYGTFFVLDVALPKPQPSVPFFAPPAGGAGQQVLLWGRNLLGATGVSFNGAPASSFTVASTQGIWADVPAGASTGPITVTTPNGSYTTSQVFTVQ
jgi:uncharacterized repeat protein (TIGR03803 family)